MLLRKHVLFLWIEFGKFRFYFLGQLSLFLFLFFVRLDTGQKKGLSFFLSSFLFPSTPWLDFLLLIDSRNKSRRESQQGICTCLSNFLSFFLLTFSLLEDTPQVQKKGKRFPASSTIQQPVIYFLSPQYSISFSFFFTSQRNSRIFGRVFLICLYLFSF